MNDKPEHISETPGVETKVVDSKTLFWNRMQLILILVVFTAPVVGAYLYKPKAFNSYGDLYSPVRPVDKVLMQALNAPAHLDDTRRQWVFLVTARDHCQQACEGNILKIRQLRFMQNNHMKRIRAVFMHTGLAPAVATDLAAKYSPIEAYNISKESFDRWIEVLKLDKAPVEAQLNRFYIIDPAGNLIMSYPATAEPNYIMKDIKRLLKTS